MAFEELKQRQAVMWGNGPFERISATGTIAYDDLVDRLAPALGRACRPGGRLGLLTWRPDSGVGLMFKTLQQFQPPHPEGAGAPLAWGEEAHLEDLLGSEFELEFSEGDAALDSDSGQEVW